MDWILQNINWVLQNKKWIFSGIAVAIPLALIGWTINFNRPINPPSPPLVDISQSPTDQNQSYQQNNTISGDGNIVTQNITIGLTLDQYTKALEKQEQKIRELQENKTLSEQRRDELTIELAEVEKRLSDKTASYQAHVKSLEQRIKELRKSPNNIPQDLLDKAIAALQEGDTEKADAVFAKVEQSAQEHIEAAAEAAYQRAKIALDNIQYRQAWQHAQRAAQIMPDKGRYLNIAGLIANILGQYGKAIEYYELALASDLNTYGEDHPDVAIRRNNLGSAYQALGQYGKAIEYYELAFATFRKFFPSDHPNIKTVQENLESAKLAQRAKGLWWRQV